MKSFCDFLSPAFLILIITSSVDDTVSYIMKKYLRSAFKLLATYFTFLIILSLRRKKKWILCSFCLSQLLHKIQNFFNVLYLKTHNLLFIKSFKNFACQLNCIIKISISRNSVMCVCIANRNTDNDDRHCFFSQMYSCTIG